MAIVRRVGHCPKMRAFVRWIAIYVAVGLALAILFGVISEFFIELARERGWYTHPSDRLDMAMSAFSSFVTHPWFYILTAAATAFAAGLWIDTVMRRREQSADHTSVSQDFIASADTPLKETPDELESKHAIAQFVFQHVIPSYLAQYNLQYNTILEVCRRKKFNAALIWSAHIKSENIRQYIMHVERLQSVITEGGFATVALAHIVESIKILSELHHEYCLSIKSLAGEDFDYQTDYATRKFYEEWRARQMALAEAFKPFKHDPRFPQLYDLADWRRVGKAFETDL